MRNTLVAALAAALALTLAGVAHAEGGGVPVHPRGVLHLSGARHDIVSGDQVGDQVVRIRWTTRFGDSPIDAANGSALRVKVPFPVDVFYYTADAHSIASVELNRPVEDMQNLSFDFRQTDHNGSRSPRITVQLSDGTVAYLAGYNCAHTLQSLPAWARADFTGRRKADCGFYDGSGFFYASDGVSTAWDVFAAAHPDANVTAAFLVFDEPGRYTVDRVALGTMRMYNRSSDRAVVCDTERAC